MLRTIDYIRLTTRYKDTAPCAYISHRYRVVCICNCMQIVSTCEVLWHWGPSVPHNWQLLKLNMLIENSSKQTHYVDRSPADGCWSRASIRTFCSARWLTRWGYRPSMLNMVSMSIGSKRYNRLTPGNCSRTISPYFWYFSIPVLCSRSKLYSPSSRLPNEKILII